MKLTKCKKCNGDVFCIQETIIHEASLDPIDRDLTVYKERTHGIDRIVCKNCNVEYLESEFKIINFR